ncbi:hypothetical protein [Streptomyces sp. NPDC093591]|uniref:hypothetical protein n=1 Tax=Streptomyces sp. NPDC093591 TaxID=3366044 RepID=UPI0037F6BA0E
MTAFLADLTVPATLSLGLVPVGALILALAFADADPAYFDPRPAVRRTTAAVHQAAVHAGHDLNRATATVQRHAGQAARDAALTVAALLILTIPTGDHR